MTLCFRVVVESVIFLKKEKVEIVKGKAFNLKLFWVG